MVSVLFLKEINFIRRKYTNESRFQITLEFNTVCGLKSNQGHIVHWCKKLKGK